ncbi:phosphatase PAP2 family protein [Hoyosella sp. YIM 151337]|uniref:phosphatase PAP2 family protein n=1 Tax=Hoyosella sp. YIM 151337 TaxID=2992742 RepID=UPI0022368915|nr:phosphatase PAP2 family protein [Hoyosella sp. YIM 151337]MCW4353073.1 phosphatase PAP2 family protein [Hoyosella sp. YIM 151337]
MDSPANEGLDLRIPHTDATARAEEPRLRAQAVRRAVGRADRRFVARTAQWRPTPVDRLMIGLSRSANRGQIWIVVAALLIALGGPARRGAVRGSLVLGASTLVATKLLKPLFPRTRPPAHAVPGTRRFSETPDTPSFPSAHAALAAAFATGVAIESRRAGYVLAPLAAAVAYSRVHTGAHWPSDVVAGSAVGVTVALVTQRFWSARRSAASVR